MGHREHPEGAAVELGVPLVRAAPSTGRRRRWYGNRWNCQDGHTGTADEDRGMVTRRPRRPDAGKRASAVAGHVADSCAGWPGRPRIATHREPAMNAPLHPAEASVLAPARAPMPHPMVDPKLPERMPPLQIERGDGVHVFDGRGAATWTRSPAVERQRRSQPARAARRHRGPAGQAGLLLPPSSTPPTRRPNWRAPDGDDRARAHGEGDVQLRRLGRGRNCHQAGAPVLEARGPG